MRKLILLVVTTIIATSSFAYTQSFSKNSPQLNALGAAWKAKQMTQPIQSQNDITIVYGGADVSRRPTLDLHTTTA